MNDLIKRGHDHTTVLDTLSMAHDLNVCIVLPSLDHAFYLWPNYRDCAIENLGGEDYVKATKTGVLLWPTHTLLRLWVPYDRQPTQPMDWEINRRNFTLVTPFDRRSPLR